MALLDRIKNFLTGTDEEDRANQPGIGQQVPGKTEEVDRAAIYHDGPRGTIGHLLAAGLSRRTADAMPGAPPIGGAEPLFGRRQSEALTDPLGLADAGRALADEPRGLVGAAPLTTHAGADRGGLFGDDRGARNQSRDGLGGSTLFGDRDQDEERRLF